MKSLCHIKKSIKILTILLIIFSFQINLFAAIISNSDGSAFITKAEFESLKNSFNAQIDNYNDSIDKKIDGSIAAYLAGISVTKPTKADIINKTWEEVSSLNGALGNTYKVPDINIQFMLGTTWAAGGDTPESVAPGTVGTQYWTAVSHLSTLKYTETWGTTTNCYRNLLVCTGPNPGDVGDMIWDGQAVRYREQWYLTRSIMENRHWAWLDRFGDVDFSITMSNLSTLKETGYFTNWNSVKSTAWPVKYRWVYTAKPSPASGSASSGDEDRVFAAADIHDNFRAVVALETDNSGEDRRYKHVINYSGETDWRVSNPKWTTLLNASPESSITSSSVKAVATLDQSAVAFGAAYHIADHQAVMDQVPITQNITDDAVFPSVGLFKVLRKAKAIYQDNVKSKIEIDKNTIVEKARPYLHQGFQLLAAKEGDKVTWEPEISYTHAHNSSTGYVDNAHQVDLYFSLGPFTDNVTTANTNKIKVKVNGGTTEKDYATTTTTDGKKKCKVEFTVPKDGIVYVKWVPHFTGTSYLNSDWIVTLDLEKCNSYTYVRE